MSDAERDAWLREALRHAPDSGALPPRELSETILASARAATRSAQGLPARHPAAHGPTHPLAAFWDWLARPSVAAGFASVMAATLVGLMWWDRPMDEMLARRPRSHARDRCAGKTPARSCARWKSPAPSAARPAERRRGRAAGRCARRQPRQLNEAAKTQRPQTRAAGRQRRAEQAGAADAKVPSRRSRRRAQRRLGAPHASRPAEAEERSARAVSRRTGAARGRRRRKRYAAAAKTDSEHAPNPADASCRCRRAPTGLARRRPPPAAAASRAGEPTARTPHGRADRADDRLRQPTAAGAVAARAKSAPRRRAQRTGAAPRARRRRAWASPRVKRRPVAPTTTRRHLASSAATRRNRR